MPLRVSKKNSWLTTGYVPLGHQQTSHRELYQLDTKFKSHSMRFEIPTTAANPALFERGETHSSLSASEWTLTLDIK